MGVRNPWRCSFDSEIEQLNKDCKSHLSCNVVQSFRHQPKIWIIGINNWWILLLHACLERIYLQTYMLELFPLGSGNFTSSHTPLQCASDSPIPCSTETESSSSSSSSPPLGFVFSFGQDIYVLASTGLYRIVRPSRSNFHCSLENQS